MLNIIYDALGNIQDTLARVRIRMVDSSDGQ